jgi:L-lactate dehydrogenase
MDFIQPAKIAIAGAGHVGAALAYSLLLQGVAGEIVLIDKDRARAEGEAMDLQHAVPFSCPTVVRAGRYSDTAGAAITVICAGVRARPGLSAEELLRNNSAMIKEIVPQIAQANPEGLILIASQPVDALTYGAWLLSGLPRHQVIGAGTLLDTARFRAMLGRHFNLAPANVEAFVLGAQGESAFPVWSAASVAGSSVVEMCREEGYGPHTLDQIFAEVRAASGEITARKGSPCYAIAAGMSNLVSAILRDEKRIFTVSSVLEDEYSISGAALSLPTVVGRRGIDRILKLELDDLEVAQLLDCGRQVQKQIHEACFVLQPQLKVS